MSSARFAPTPGTIADQLRCRLLALDYPAFARCLCVLLEALGYEEAHPAGRREWKGYNRPGGGGYDLEAVLPGGLSPRRVVAQIKQFDGLRVHQRSVDEVRGACLRAGAAESLLITTSAFSEVVRKRAASKHDASLDLVVAPVAPVRLIDGQELLSLLISHRLGIRERVQGGTRRLEMDDAFFREVSTRDISAESSGPAGAATPTPRESSGRKSSRRGNSMKPRWRVTIHIAFPSHLASASAPESQNAGTAERGLADEEMGKGGR